MLCILVHLYVCASTGCSSCFTLKRSQIENFCQNIFVMKFLLLLLITIAIVANGVEGLKCYGYSGVGVISDEQSDAYDGFKQNCDETDDKVAACIKTINGEQGTFLNGMGRGLDFFLGKLTN